MGLASGDGLKPVLAKDSTNAATSGPLESVRGKTPFATRPWTGRLSRIMASLLLLLGIWQLGGGLYIHAKALAAQVLLQNAWHRTLQGESRARPWSWADTWPVARIRVPRLAVDQLVVAGASGRSLAFGPGHVDGTAKPGDAGNLVISGHRDTHFGWLAKVKPGEEIILELPDGGHRNYLVMQGSIHHESETGILGQAGFPLLTLITCYPFDAIRPGGPLRYVVTARTSDS